MKSGMLMAIKNHCVRLRMALIALLVGHKLNIMYYLLLQC